MLINTEYVMQWYILRSYFRLFGQSELTTLNENCPWGSFSQLQEENFFYQKGCGVSVIPTAQLISLQKFTV